MLHRSSSNRIDYDKKEIPIRHVFVDTYIPPSHYSVVATVWLFSGCKGTMGLFTPAFLFFRCFQMGGSGQDHNSCVIMARVVAFKMDWGVLICCCNVWKCAATMHVSNAVWHTWTSGGKHLWFQRVCGTAIGFHTEKYLKLLNIKDFKTNIIHGLYRVCVGEFKERKKKKIKEKQSGVSCVVKV